VDSQCYTFATATLDAFHLFKLDPFSGRSVCSPVIAGAIHKPISCLCFSRDGDWLYGGSSSGEVVTLNTKRLAIQMTHPVMHGGVFAMAHVGQQVCSCFLCFLLILSENGRLWHSKFARNRNNSGNTNSVKLPYTTCASSA
jgi:hypothetical protein